MTGRSIRLFLVEGTSTGLRTAEIGLSTIKALVVPRTLLASAASRPEIRRTGVSVLVGPDPDEPAIRRVYVGEGDMVLDRLVQHDKSVDKDFWEEAVVLVSKDENLTKAHVRYLEARLVQLAGEARQCRLANGTKPPTVGKLPEPDQVEMEEFIEQTRLLLGALGHDVFTPLSAPTPKGESVSARPGSAQTFRYSGKGFDATAVLDPNAGGLVVLKGSVARSKTVPSLSVGPLNRRQALIADGVLVPQGAEGLLFTADFAFKSPSGAAQIVAGMSTNGLNAWKTTDSGISYGEWQSQQLAEADVPTEG